jgi:hypothetical protein
MRPIHLTLAFFLMCGSAAFGSVLFSDNFESPSGLLDGNWASNSSGVVLTDPLNAGNHVLGFTSHGSGGDLFSVPIPSSAAPNYFLSFDYYVPGQPGGGFVGVDDPGELWLAGNCNGCFGTPFPLDSLPAGQWNHVQIEFTNTQVGAGTFDLKLEQFSVGTPPSAFFDNIVISDSGFSSVPEPSSVILVSTAMLALAFAARKRITQLI